MCQLYSSHKKYLRTVTWLLVAYNSNIVAISESSNNFHEKISHFIFNPLHQIIHVYILYFPCCDNTARFFSIKSFMSSNGLIIFIKS